MNQKPRENANDGTGRTSRAPSPANFAGSGAGQLSGGDLGAGQALCTVFTCLGRRIVLGQMVDEELEAAERRLGPGTVMTGFYSYGELGPLGQAQVCDLHNQTMCMTTIQE